MISFAGKGFSKLIAKSLTTHGRNVETYLKFKRPTGLTMNFKEICKRLNTPFMIGLKALPGKKQSASEGLDIKGRMVFCPESNSLLFIGSPFLD